MDYRIKIGIGAALALVLLLGGMILYKKGEVSLPSLEPIVKEELQQNRSRVRCITQEERLLDPTCKWADDALKQRNAP